MTRLMPALAAVFALSGFTGTVDARLMEQAVNPAVFARTAAFSNQFEIQSSQLALQKSQNDAVKEFARLMIADHTMLEDKMKAAIAKADMQMPGDRLDAKHSQQIKQLQMLNGSGFDRQFLMDQLQGHEQAVTLIGDYSRGGTNPALKQWAAEGLPIIQHHLELVKDLEKSFNRSVSR